MRLCRFREAGQVQVGLFGDAYVMPLRAAADAMATKTGRSLQLPDSVDLMDYLPPDGQGYPVARTVAEWAAQRAASGSPLEAPQRPLDAVELLVPIPHPNKLLLLAGNYAQHIEEGGGKAAERAETFPYVFMKPPSTTLTDPGKPIVIPAASPNAIDWELELAVVIGQKCKGVKEADALQYVAGYMVLNDISDRRFKPNPNRKPRERDNFFDWLHGKWHDSFCPCGPCVATPDAVPDPQQLKMTLRVNSTVRQDASTAQMIFPVAAVIEFISSFVTLEPGDIVSTGTPHGVGHAKGTFLKAGDELEATIERIGTLRTGVRAES